jgi:gamma-glutamyl-gamma-aminobutyrate hydrolase PuuD
MAPDGLIEGVARKDTLSYPCYIGVQWHPERSAQGQPLVENVGAFFVEHMLKAQASSH